MSFSVDFRQHSMVQMHDALVQRRVAPEALALHCTAMYQATEEAAKAWTCFDGSQLLNAARHCGQRLAQGEPPRGLEGLPVGVQDIFDTARLPTQWGSPLRAGFTPGSDARAVFSLQRAGALVAGKTATSEWAVQALGKTVNPWAVERTPGTGGSGSAVAVALGVVPMALAAQTAGCIMQAASFCGVWGMKPSFGLIPRAGMLNAAESLGTVGFFAGHAEDLPHVLDALRVQGHDQPLSDRVFRDGQRQSAPQSRPWRVGFVRPHVWQYASLEAQVALVDWLKRLQTHARFEVLEARLPEEMAECQPLHATLYSHAMAAQIQREFQAAGQLSPALQALVDAGHKISAASCASALQRQISLARTMDEFTQGFDVLVTLSTAGEAPLRHLQAQPDASLVWTLTQLPSISAPVFLGPNSLPFGLQLVARRHNDPLLMRFVAEAVQHGFLPASSFEQRYGACAAGADAQALVAAV